MKIEKKIIVLSVLVIVIGIAVIVPITLFMKPEVVQKINTEAWFNVEVPYAYFKANETDSGGYASMYSIAYLPTVNKNAIKSQAEARIEYYEFVIYTDDVQLLKVNYFICLQNSEGANPIDAFSFSRQNWFNSTDFGRDSYNGNFITNNDAYIRDIADLKMGCSAAMYEPDEGIELNEKMAAVLSVMKGRQTVYLDVIRVGYVTFDGNNTIVTLASDPIIQHLKMTKTGDALTFGDPALVDDRLGVFEPKYR
jgi:hypothetical protein